MAATATEPADGASVRPEHQITTLDCGVRVVTERVPGVRSVALGFWIATGSAAEREAEAGISHLLEHMLFRGTERYGSEEIDQIFDAMGAEINAGTDKEATSLYTRVLDGHLERAFDVMGDMIWHPRFGELEAEREVVLEEIAMYEDDPQDRVFDILGRAIFGEHPLGRPVIGRAEVVAGVDREQIAAFHAERYRPPVIVIAAAGSLDHEPDRRGWPPRAPRRGPRRKPGPGPGPRRRHPSSRRAATSWRKTPSSTTCASAGAGIARDDERRFALRVLEGVLGGHVLLAPVPGGPRAPRPRLLGLLLLQPVCAHRRGRPLPRHPPGEPRPGARRRRRRARALRAGPRQRAGADPLAGKPQGPGRARAGVDRARG